MAIQKDESPEKIALEVRRDVLTLLSKAGSGHTAGSLSAVEIITALYFGVMHQDPKNPNWEERDRFVLSNGHVCPTLYAVLAKAGYFPREKLKTYAKLNSFLQGHPERERLPGIETTSGPLGSGLAQAVGMALAARLNDARFRIFCLTSDGEHNEGNHWEAVLLAAKYKLGNLTLFVDRNMIQIEGETEKTLPLEPLREKYLAFNWHVLEINGHSFREIAEAVREARGIYEKPTVIIAKTVAGKGVSFMENESFWHARVPSKEELKKALAEL